MVLSGRFLSEESRENGINFERRNRRRQITAAIRERIEEASKPEVKASYSKAIETLRYSDELLEEELTNLERRRIDLEERIAAWKVKLILLNRGCLFYTF